MEGIGLTPFDIIVILVLVVSALFAFGKGFATEVLSLAAWAGAILITLYGLACAAGYGREYISPEPLADMITAIVLFFAGLIILKLIAGFIGDCIRMGPVGFLDRSLGALFGLLRGILIVSAGYLLLNFFLSERQQPEWVQEAKLIRFVSYGAEMLSEIVPELLSRAKEDEEVQGILDRMRENMPSSNSSTEDDETAYDELERKALDAAFDIYQDINEKQEEKDPDRN